MIMADVLKYALLILGLLLVFGCYWLFFEALFPALVTRARHHYNRPVRATLLGLLFAAPVGLLGGVIANLPHPGLKIVGFGIIFIPVVLGLLGSAGLAQRVGIGLPSAIDASQPWRRVLRGSIILSLTFLLPLIGWFVVLPWVLVSGFGTAVMAMRDSRKTPLSAPSIPSLHAAAPTP